MNLKSLFAIFAILIILSSVSIVSAADDEGNGTMDYDPIDDNYVPQDDNMSEEADTSPVTTGSSGSSHEQVISLSKHQTANPVVMLMAALAVFGFATTNLKK